MFPLRLMLAASPHPRFKTAAGSHLRRSGLCMATGRQYPQAARDIAAPASGTDRRQIPLVTESRTRSAPARVATNSLPVRNACTSRKKMKYIILIILVAGGFYTYANYPTENISVDSYQALLKKVGKTEVTLQEVKAGSDILAEFFCKDSGFQESGGSTVSSCLRKFNSYREMCESRVFGNAPATFTTKEQVVAIAKSYASCTGSTN